MIYLLVVHRNTWFTSGMYSYTEKFARWLGDNTRIESALMDNQAFVTGRENVVYRFVGTYL